MHVQIRDNEVTNANFISTIRSDRPTDVEVGTRTRSTCMHVRRFHVMPFVTRQSSLARCVAVRCRDNAKT